MRRVRLGELISKAKVERCGDRDFPVLSMTMHDGIVRQTDRFKKAIASKDVSLYKVVRPNQLVVGFPIDEGVIYVQGYDCPGIMSPAYNVWDIDSDRIVPVYLELALHSPRSMAYYAERMRGTTARRRSITSENLTAMQVPLPSLDEQLNVISTLGSVKKLASDCSRTLSLLDDLVKSRFVELFGDSDIAFERLDDVAEVQGGLTKNRRRESLGLKLPYLRVANVLPNSIDLSEVKVIGLTEQECMAKRLKPGDLLIVEGNGSGEQIGRSAIWNGEIEPCTHQNHLIRVRFGEKVLPVFAQAYLSSSHGRGQIVSKAVNTSGLYTLSTGKIRSLIIPVPPLSLQREFASFAAEVAKSQFIGRTVRDCLYCYVQTMSLTAERGRCSRFSSNRLK